MSIIKDISLRHRGQRKIDWVYDSMGVLNELEHSLECAQPFQGKIIASKTVVVAGYGFCGRGIVKRMRGMGAGVILKQEKTIRSYEWFFIIWHLPSFPLSQYNRRDQA